MSLYEATFIIRQDLASADVQNVAGVLKAIVTGAGGSVVKEENWGLRRLAHKINKSKRGHYIHFGFDTTGDVVAELDRKSRLSEDIVRNLILKVEAISKDPSPLLEKEKTDQQRRAA